MSHTPGPEDDISTVGSEEEEEEEEEEELPQCVVCLQPRIDMMSTRKTANKMIPCGHLTICKPCFHRCDRCPLCRKRYHNNEHIMTVVEEKRLKAKLQRASDRRMALNEKIAELQTKRLRVEDEFAELTAIRERQRVLLRRRANHLDESNFVHV